MSIRQNYVTIFVNLHKESQERVVLSGVVDSIKDSQKDQPCGTSDCPYNRNYRANLLEPRRVRGKTTPVPQPSFQYESHIKRYDGDRSHRDKERFQAVGSNVRYVTFQMLV